VSGASGPEEERDQRKKEGGRVGEEKTGGDDVAKREQKWRENFLALVWWSGI